MFGIEFVVVNFEIENTFVVPVDDIVQLDSVLVPGAVFVVGTHDHPSADRSGFPLKL